MHLSDSENRVVALGVNPEGHLIVSGDVPSPYGTTAVGLRYMSTQDEALSHACWCEGWGVADASTGTVGWANEDFGGTHNLELVSFDKALDTLVSTVRVADHLEVTHDIRSAGGTNFLFEWTVTVRNISDDPVDLRYRRVLDWDVDPTPFEEFVTIDTFGNQAVPALAFSSNNGFGSADPLTGSTDLGETGFFTDAGPDDHAALFDFNLGPLAPGATRTFYLYYGAAPSEGDALTALAIVSAQLYSFGQSSNPDGTVNNSGKTFIFAFRDEAGG